jgi:hypothetical protein
LGDILLLHLGNLIEVRNGTVDVTDVKGTREYVRATEELLQKPEFGNVESILRS